MSSTDDKRIPCAKCGYLILLSIAEKNNGWCPLCRQQESWRVEDSDNRVPKTKNQFSLPGQIIYIIVILCILLIPLIVYIMWNELSNLIIKYGIEISLVIISIYFIHQTYWTVAYYLADDETESRSIFYKSKHGWLSCLLLLSVIILINLL